MEETIKTGKVLGYFFAILGSIATVATLIFGHEEKLLLLLALWFGFFVWIGVHLIRNPKLLVRVTDTVVELYPGSLVGNWKQMEIPLSEIEKAGVVLECDSEGNTWLLKLRLRSVPKVPPEARRWMDSMVPKDLQEKADPYILYWGLSWAAGGGRKAQAEVKRIFDRALQQDL